MLFAIGDALVIAFRDFVVLTVCVNNWKPHFSTAWLFNIDLDF